MTAVARLSGVLRCTCGWIMTPHNEGGRELLRCWNQHCERQGRLFEVPEIELKEVVSEQNAAGEGQGG